MTELNRGVVFGVAAYGLWGLVPLFWPLLKPAGAVEILAYRVVWSLVFAVVLLAVLQKWSWVRTMTLRTLGLLAVAALLISVNWGAFIYSVNSGNVVEASLGYFINPLVSVLFGVALLGERLRTAQWAAVGLGLLAVVVLTVDYGRPPWFALAMAASFGTYGLIKKYAHTGAAQSLTVESALLAGPALAFVLVLELRGEGVVGLLGAGHLALLAVGGLVTLVPLLLFTGAANRIPLSLVGLLQYIAPSIQFLLGVFVFAEEMPPTRWIGFAIVWAALCVFSWDALRRARRPLPLAA